MSASPRFMIMIICSIECIVFVIVWRQRSNDFQIMIRKSTIIIIMQQKVRVGVGTKPWVSGMWATFHTLIARQSHNLDCDHIALSFPVTFLWYHFDDIIFLFLYLGPCQNRRKVLVYWWTTRLWKRKCGACGPRINIRDDTLIGNSPVNTLYTPHIRSIQPLLSLSISESGHPDRSTMGKNLLWRPIGNNFIRCVSVLFDLQQLTAAIARCGHHLLGLNCILLLCLFHLCGIIFSITRFHHPPSPFTILHPCILSVIH
jgi:hypothetical protein